MRVIGDEHDGIWNVNKSILKLAAFAARVLPTTIKRQLYSFPALARFIRRKLNQAAPDGLTAVQIAAGNLSGLQMYLDLQSEKDYWLGTYEPELISAIQEFVEPGMIAYDVGANVGYITLLLSQSVGERGQVFAFEALPQNVTRLRANVSANNLESRIVIVNSAVIDRAGPVEFLFGPSAGMGKALGSAGRKEIEYSQSITITGISLDSFVYDHGNPEPQVIKLDIEGGEVLALVGMKNLLYQVRPLLLLELHGPEAAKVAWETLKSAGYRIHRLASRYPEVNNIDQLDWKAYLLAKPI